MAQPAPPPRSSEWWLPLAGLVALVPLLALAGLVLPPDAAASLVLLPLVGVGFVLTLFSAIGVHFDREYVAGVSAWRPSAWYYLVAVPPLSVVVSAVYLYNRHRHVGVP